MSGPLKWVLLLVVCIRAQDPSKRHLLFCQSYDTKPMKIDSEKFDCSDTEAIAGKCISKRFVPEEMTGPFWANRGKKTPTYMREPLFAEEPYWLLISGDTGFHEEPFFLSRGKKETGASHQTHLRDTREFLQDNDAPFFAARGKRFKIKH